MRARTTRSILLSAIALATCALVLAGGACGGSSSESPWPAEPESPVLGPAGEEGKSLDQATDAGTDAGSVPMGPQAAPNPGAPSTPVQVEP